MAKRCGRDFFHVPKKSSARRCPDINLNSVFATKTAQGQIGAKTVRSGFFGTRVKFGRAQAPNYHPQVGIRNKSPKREKLLITKVDETEKPEPSKERTSKRTTQRRQSTTPPPPPPTLAPLPNPTRPTPSLISANCGVYR